MPLKPLAFSTKSSLLLRHSLLAPAGPCRCLHGGGEPGCRAPLPRHPAALPCWEGFLGLGASFGSIATACCHLLAHADPIQKGVSPGGTAALPPPCPHVPCGVGGTARQLAPHPDPMQRGQAETVGVNTRSVPPALSLPSVCSQCPKSLSTTPGASPVPPHPPSCHPLGAARVPRCPGEAGAALPQAPWCLQHGELAGAARQRFDLIIFPSPELAIFKY